jgi:hypothetical protein
MLNTYVYLIYYVHIYFMHYVHYIHIFIYLTYYVRLVGIKEVTDCRNARCGKLQNNDYPY